MDGTISAHEAKVKFGELLARVSKGEEIIITRNGLPTARIIPEGNEPRKEMAEWIEGFIERRKICILNPPGLPKISIRELIEEGRRD